MKRIICTLLAGMLLAALLGGCGSDQASLAAKTTLDKLSSCTSIAASFTVRNTEDGSGISADLDGILLFREGMQVDMIWSSYQWKDKTRYRSYTNRNGTERNYSFKGSEMDMLSSGSWGWRDGSTYKNDEPTVSAPWNGSNLQGYLTGLNLPGGVTGISVSQRDSGYTLSFSIQNDSELHQLIKSYLKTYICQVPNDITVQDLRVTLEFYDNHILRSGTATFSGGLSFKQYNEIDLISLIYYD